MSVNKLKQTVLGIVAISLFLASGTVLADYALNLTEGVTPTSHKAYELHMVILYIVIAIGVAVFSVMGWSIFHHRKLKGYAAHHFHHSTMTEIIWTVVPILILVGMAVPATKMLINMEETGRGMSNHGELIVPPRPIVDLSLIDPIKAGRKKTLHGKWSLVYVSRSCDQLCVDNVYRMRQIHIAMDKNSLRVQKILLLTQQHANELSDLLFNYAGQQVINTDLIDTNALVDKFRLTSSDNPLEAGRIYIIDPLGNLMMSYQPDANPRDIMQDLKKLLSASHIGQSS